MGVIQKKIQKWLLMELKLPNSEESVLIYVELLHL
ncbi:hypothetical protein BVRB_5g110340 [Beta vulgaris subsp. vulgaris]|nr:hypothetical protein BVRB_5g110340 [Beta vulgaris subsp. vulgaris]